MSNGLLERLGGARQLRDAAKGILLVVGAIGAAGALAGNADAYLTESLGIIGTGAVVVFAGTTVAAVVRSARLDPDTEGGGPDTAATLELYQAEGCPHCAKVRRFCTEHGISLTLHNPRTKGTIVTGGTITDRDRHEELTGYGQDQVPLLVDTERGQSLYESDDIVDYLDEHYA